LSSGFPFQCSIAIAVHLIWIVVEFKVTDYITNKAVLETVTYFIATLTVAYLCALGLAHPVVLVVDGGIAARNGVTSSRQRPPSDPLRQPTSSSIKQASSRRMIPLY
jgi:hypothetical protein